MGNNQKKVRKQEDSFRDEVENFAQYIKTKDKSYIEHITLETLKKAVDCYKFSHSRMEWFKAMEKRIKELENKQEGVS